MKKHELAAAKEAAEKFAKRFMESGIPYTCGEVVLAWMRQQSDYDGSWRIQRMTWDRVHELARAKT